MTSYDVSWFAQPSFPILVITFCFVELSDAFGGKKGIAKQMEVLLTIGELSTLTTLRILHSCRPFYVILVNLSIWPRCRADMHLLGNLRPWRRKQIIHDFDEFKFRIHIIHIFKDLKRKKKNKKKTAITTATTIDLYTL